MTYYDVEQMLHCEVNNFRTIAIGHHVRAVVARENYSKGVRSPGSFAYNARESALFNEKARQALFQLIGNREPYED